MSSGVLEMAVATYYRYLRERNNATLGLKILSTAKYPSYLPQYVLQVHADGTHADGTHDGQPPLKPATICFPSDLLYEPTKNH